MRNRLESSSRAPPRTTSRRVARCSKARWTMVRRGQRAVDVDGHRRARARTTGGDDSAAASRVVAFRGRRSARARGGARYPPPVCVAGTDIPAFSFERSTSVGARERRTVRARGPSRGGGFLRRRDGDADAASGSRAFADVVWSSSETLARCVANCEAEGMVVRVDMETLQDVDDGGGRARVRRGRASRTSPTTLGTSRVFERRTRFERHSATRFVRDIAPTCAHRLGISRVRARAAAPADTASRWTRARGHPSTRARRDTPAATPPPPPPLPLRAPPPPPPVPKIVTDHQFHHRRPPTSSAPADVDRDADALRSMPKRSVARSLESPRRSWRRRRARVKAELAAGFGKNGRARGDRRRPGRRPGPERRTAPARSMVPTSSAYVFEPSSRPVFGVDAPTRAARSRSAQYGPRPRPRRRPNALPRRWIARSDSRHRGQFANRPPTPRSSSPSSLGMKMRDAASRWEPGESPPRKDVSSTHRGSRRWRRCDRRACYRAR